MAYAQSLFAWMNLVAAIAWLPLALSLFVPRIRRWTWRGTGVLVPGLFGVGYVTLIAFALANGRTGGSFATISGIRTLFSDDFFLLAGWIHYLAFDLVAGTWIARSGTRSGVRPLLLLPALLLTFLAGPTGFLLYLLVRTGSGPRRWAGDAA